MAPRVFRRRAVLLAALPVCLAASAAVAQAQPAARLPVPDRCVLTKPAEYGYVILRRKELQAEPFAPALQIFIDDLLELESEGDELADQIALYERTDCNPHNADVKAYYQVEDAYITDCNSGPVAPDVKISCDQRLSGLHARVAGINQRHAALQQKELAFAERAQRFDARALRARENAERVLDFDNVEHVLRLYVWTLRKARLATGTPTSCESFGRLLDALGARVRNQGLFIDYLSRTLIEERLDLNFFSGDPRLTPLAGSTFNATGFRRQYYAVETENQVRHVLGFIAAGYYRMRTPALVASYFLDYIADTEEDFDLAVEGAKLGVALRTGTYTTANFGRAFRGRVCN